METYRIEVSSTEKGAAIEERLELSCDHAQFGTVNKAHRLVTDWKYFGMENAFS